MKNIIYIATFLVPMVFFAQEKPKNVSEETTTKTITVDDGREVVEKKVKVTTREEQKIKLAESDKHKVNQDIVESPSKVTQIVEVDNDKDPFFDSKSATVYYTSKDDNYIFKKTNLGFTILETNSGSGIDYGQGLKTSRANNYLFTTKNLNGIGHFDSKGNFIVEYYNMDTNTLVKKVFTLKK